jgi:hypothetical protein
VLDAFLEPTEKGIVFVVESGSGGGGDFSPTPVIATHLDAKSGALKALVRTAIVLQNTETEPDQQKGKADAEYNRPWIEKVMYLMLPG